MKSKFNQLFENIMNNHIQQEYLLVENISNILEKSNNIIYQTNKILQCPQKVIQVVKQKILNLLKANNYNVEKIFINDVFSFDQIYDISDKNLLNTIIELFKDHQTAYFNIKIEGDQDLWFDKKRRIYFTKRIY